MAASNHTFKNFCIDFAQLLSQPNLDNMLAVAYAQSTQDAAFLSYDPLLDDKTRGDFCAQYFGGFGEWLCGHYLQYYGDQYDLIDINPVDSVGSTIRDMGTDIEAKTQRARPITGGRTAKQGSPVYIQVKTTLDSKKIYMVNDGSRISNFCANAFGSAIVKNKSQQSRFILITTGDSLNYTLNDMSSKLLEVINYKEMKRNIDDKFNFLNYLRDEVGLNTLVMSESTEDDPE